MDSTTLLDSYGRKILKELQENARLSVAELGRRFSEARYAATPADTDALIRALDRHRP